MSRSTLSDRRTAPASPPRRIFHARRWATIAAVLAAIAMLIAVGAVASRAHATLAQLRIRAGKAEIDHGARGFVKASDGSDVAPGDIVRTSSGAQAIVDYFDGSVTRMDSSTKLEIRKLTETKSGDRIELSLADGRIWDHVREATSPSDAFSLRLSSVVISSAGSTFLTDCRSTDACYVVDFDGTTHISSSTGDQADLDVAQCEQIAPDGSLATCDASKLGLVDEWVRANLAEDQELVANVPAPSPSPSPTPAPDLGSSGSGFVPHSVATRAPLRTPSKTAPPSTPVPTKDKNNDGSVPTPPPSPHHRPHGSANP
jgi:FecR-like protein